MDETEFWELVDATREAVEGDPEDHADLLVERLVRLDPDAVLDSPVTSRPATTAPTAGICGARRRYCSTG